MFIVFYCIYYYIMLYLMCFQFLDKTAAVYEGNISTVRDGLVDQLGWTSFPIIPYKPYSGLVLVRSRRLNTVLYAYGWLYTFRCIFERVILSWESTSLRLNVWYIYVYTYKMFECKRRVSYLGNKWCSLVDSFQDNFIFFVLLRRYWSNIMVILILTFISRLFIIYQFINLQIYVMTVFILCKEIF